MTAGELPVVDLRDPAFWRDIHTPLRAARTIHPIAVMPGGERLALGYDEVMFVLRDPRFRSTDLLARSGVRSGRLHEWWSTVMFSTDPPVHTRLRRLVSRAFTPRAVDNMRPLIRDITDELLDRVVEQGHMDVLHDFAHHLPVKVIGTMLGVPDGDYPTFASWTTTLGRAFSPVIDDAPRQRLEEAIRGLDDYVGRLIDERRRRPGDDLLSQLIAAEEDGDRLSVDELVAMVENLLFAGHDTTRGLLSIALPLLCDHPEQLDRVRSDPQLIAAAVEEILRYEPPVMGGAREAAERVEIAPGVTIDEGERVSIDRSRQSRAVRLRRSRFVRHRTHRQEQARELRSGHPLLPRRRPGARRSGGRAAPTVRTLRCDPRDGCTRMGAVRTNPALPIGSDHLRSRGAKARVIRPCSNPGSNRAAIARADPTSDR